MIHLGVVGLDTLGLAALGSDSSISSSARATLWANVKGGYVAATLQIAEDHPDAVDGEGRCVNGPHPRLQLWLAERITLGGGLVMPYSLRSMIRNHSRTSEENNFHALVMTRSLDSPVKQP